MSTRSRRSRCARAGARHAVAARGGRASSWACARFSSDGGFGAFTDTFEDLARLRQLPGIAAQRLMADGYGFGAEGDWKSAALVRLVKVMARGTAGRHVVHGGLHLPPRRGDAAGAGRPHARDLPDDRQRTKPRCEIHPLAIGGRADPVRLVFAAPPGPGMVVGLMDLGTRLRLVANEVDVVEPAEDMPRLPVARALWEPRPSHGVAAEAWLTAGGPHHTCFSQAIGVDALEDFAEIAGVELLSIGAETTTTGFRKEVRWNQAYYHLAGGL